MSEVEPSKVNVVPRNTDYNPMIPKAGTALANCPTNLDLTTKKGKALAIAAGNPSDLEPDKNGVLKIRATHYIIFPDVRMDEETGEMSEFCRTVFFTKEGDIFRTSAQHGPARLGALLSLYTPAEWIDGIPLLIRVRKSKRDRFYHDIRVDTSEQ
jgi:hypothetical protein